MSSKIRVLTDHTINKIAAGEVIENPASVVKELVENALDAGATEICIEIKGGGRQLIRITDNGCGMSADDALLCLERHATSKIREVEDLLSIDTMGFRGEAIPSIASISKFTLITSPNPPIHPEQIGTMVSVDGGKILHSSPAACSPGTCIEVKNLFFNVPVRKKFQKSPAYDANEIQKMLTLLALGYPTIKFQLISNEKSILTAPQPKKDSLQKNIGQRIEDILGKDFFEEVIPLESHKNECSLHGFIGLPSAHRPNRTGQYLFINKRAVYSPFVAYVVKEGYGPSLPPNRHPIFVLHLHLPGQWVDVNVHPQKKEVRLRQESLFKEMIFKAVENALRECGQTSLPLSLPPLPFKAPVWDLMPPEMPPMPSITTPKTTYSSPSFPPIAPEPMRPLPQIPPSKAETPTLNLFPAAQPKPPLPKILSTLARYILVEPSSLDPTRGEGLCLIDHHRAHARIIYEKLSAEHGANSSQNISSQLLLIPYTFDTTPTQSTLILKQMPFLNTIGISLKPFGSRSFNIDALPQCFGNIDVQEFCRNLLQQLEENSPESFEKENFRRIALAANRAAIAKGKRLSLEEAQGLLRQWSDCQNRYHCPQGRPIVAYLSLDELERFFK